MKNKINLIKGYVLLYRDLTQPSTMAENYCDLNTALIDARDLSDCYENIVVSIYKQSINDLRLIASFYHGKTFDEDTEL